MLCSLCQHGTTVKIDGKPTGNAWECPCGETNCRHITRCSCGEMKPRQSLISQYVILKRLITTKYAAGGDYQNLLQQANKIPLTPTERKAADEELGSRPMKGDCVSMGECHFGIDEIEQEGDAWKIINDEGEEFYVIRDPGNDNELRRAWKLP